MKAQFPEYYRPTLAEFRHLWDECLFAVDANVLLNVYGYSIETREALISLFEKLAPRLRIPHQFAMEYQRNRARAIMEQVKNYAKVEKTLSDVYKEDLEPKQKHPYLTKRNLAAFRRIQEDLCEGRKKHESLFSDDHYAERIAVIFATIGTKSPNLAAIHEKAKQRYASKIPPGYADVKDKGEPDCFGDCVGWLQILEMGKAEQKPLILLTDDSKEDWWQIQSDRTIGPRPELMAEYLAECGKPFYMYTSGRFMDFASEYLNQPVEKNAIEEVNLKFDESMLKFLENLKEKSGGMGLTSWSVNVPGFFVPIREKSQESKSGGDVGTSPGKTDPDKESKGGDKQT